MSLVIVDLRCSTKTGKGCFAAGLNVLRQMFLDDFMPRKMVILTDKDGESILYSLGAIQDNTIDINGEAVIVRPLSYLNKVSLDARVDTYLRLGVCGMFQEGTSYFKPMPKFKNGVPRVVVLSMQHTASSLGHLKRLYRNLYTIPAEFILLGFNSDRSGLFGIEAVKPSEQTQVEFDQPYRLMHPDPRHYKSHPQRDPRTDVLRFLSFSMQQNNTITTFVYVGGLDFIKQVAMLYALNNHTKLLLCTHGYAGAAVYFEIDSTQSLAINDPDHTIDGGLVIHCYQQLPPATMKAYIAGSDTFVFVSGLVLFYEAIMFGKIVFSQNVGHNMLAYADITKVLSVLLNSEYQVGTLSRNIQLLINFFMFPDICKSKQEEVLTLLKSQPDIVNEITALFLRMYNEASQRFLNAVRAPFLYIEEMNRPDSAALRRYVGSLFREACQSATADAAEAFELDTFSS